MANNNARLKEALVGASSIKEKGPLVADGILSVTPDPPEAVEWRNKSILDSAAAGSTFLDDDGGKQTNELFGKFTWKIDNFSEISKRELRSNQFDVGEYKWYILVYPQGCDVCNHLSLFLCVADYDKLLPGWSHFAQFTIAVVNKDPKKSKYSDTLHRFCKKEHDWGWKKFMELSKVLDGFTVANTLVIKAQVQVILDRPNRPFRCLDAQYRRELVRVYLTNVESICRRLCEEKKQRLQWLTDEAASFKAWWQSISAERQRQLTTERGEAILKGVVKQFFNEKEVTSTLVMDALFCGCKQLDKLSRSKEAPAEGAAPCVVINGKACIFSFALDALDVMEQLGSDFIPASQTDKSLPVGADGLALRSGCDELSELRRDALERDEKRLAELGRRTVEMFALAHIFTERLERAYRDYQAEKRMKDLIAEEEAAGRLEDERMAARAAADKEKKAKKKKRKQAKKDAEQAKRDAEEAERLKQEQQRRAELERKNAEANQRRRHEEAALLQQQQQQAAQQKQRQADKAAAVRSKQQIKAAAAASEEPCSSDSHSCDQNTSVYVPPSTSNNQDGQWRQQQRRGANAAAATSQGSSRPYSAPSSSGRVPNGLLGRFSSTSSPAQPASVASIAESTSDACSSSDTSDSCSIDSGSKGYAPVSHPSQHSNFTQQEQYSREAAAAASRLGQQQGQPPPPPPPHPYILSSNGNLPNGLPAGAIVSRSASGSSSSGNIPTGYAAAVAGMRPPPPAEVTAAAATMAEQQRKVRDLEDQVSGLNKQVQGLETDVKQKDMIVAEKDHEIATLRGQLSQHQQQVQELQRLVSELKAAASIGNGVSSADGPASSSSNEEFGSSQSGAASAGQLDRASSAASATPVPWAAIAAGTATVVAVRTPSGVSSLHNRTGSPRSSQDSDSTSPTAAGIDQTQSSSSGGSSSSSGDGAGTSGTAGPSPNVSYAGRVGRPQSAHKHSNSSGPVLNGVAVANSGSQPGHQLPNGLAESSAAGRNAAANLQHYGSAPDPMPLAAGGTVPTSGTSSSLSNGSVAAAADPRGEGDTGQETAVDKQLLAVSSSGLIRSTSAGTAGSTCGTGHSLDDSMAGSMSASSMSKDMPLSSSMPSTSGMLSRLSNSGNSNSNLGHATSSSGSNSKTGNGSAQDALPSLSLKGSETAAGAGPGSYLVNGGGGVRQSSTPLSNGDGQAGRLTPSYHNAAAGSRAAVSANGSDGLGTAAAGSNAGAQGDSLRGPSSSGLSSKAIGLSGPAQHPFGGFSSQMPAATRGMAFGHIPPSKAGGDAVQRASQSPIMDDNGLDGFVHMNMIDDLLTE